MALIQYLARIQFAHGARAELPAELDMLGVRRPLVVTDAGVVRAGVLAQALEALLPGRVAAVFDAVPPNPTEASVQAALDTYRDAGCDGVVAVGGGSVIDAAKAVALLATHPGPLGDYRVGGARRIGPSVAPVVSVPTTAGTGSEVGRGMGITLAEGDVKAVFISPHLIPRAAICDPDLTAGLPPSLAAGTGIDALSHCVEAFLSPAVNPPADAVALDGIARLVRHLPDAVANAGMQAGAEARWNTMMGAVEGAMAMWKGLGAAHALSMPLDALGLHHGTAIGVVLPHAMRFVTPAVPPERLARLAAALGGDPAEALASLARAIGLPPGLAALGATPEHLPRFAAEAADTPFNATSARPADAAGYLALARAAL